MSPMVKAPLTIEHAALGLLRQRPMHAYEMHQTLQRAGALGMVWRIKQSLLYAILDRLEAEGLVAGEIVPQGSRPPRNVLRLTEAGARAFERWLAAPVSHGRDFRLEFLAKLYFASQAGSASATALIDAQRAACAAWLEELRRQAERAAAEPYEWLVFQFRIGQIEAIAAWLATCAATLTLLPR